MPGQATTGKAGIGVVLKVHSGGSPGTWATVGNVTTMTVGGVTINMIDATHLNSPNFYGEFIPGLKTSDDWTFTVQWDPSDPTQDGTTGFKKMAEDRSIETFRMDPSAIDIDTGIECDGYISALGGIETSPEGIMTRQCTIKPTGATREVDLS